VLVLPLQYTACLDHDGAQNYTSISIHDMTSGKQLLQKEEEKGTVDFLDRTQAILGNRAATVLVCSSLFGG